MTNVFETFSDAYSSVVAEVMKMGLRCEPVIDNTSVGSQFGEKFRETKEIVGHQFTVRQPRSRSVCSPVREVSDTFCRANFVWTLTGGSDVEGVSFYNPRGRVFAKKSAFYEAAFGARLFYPFQQFRLVEERLRKDPASRRGLAMIYIPEDTQVDKLDTPCAAYLHFMIRDNRLICICNMRSQSALMVLPYDFHLFTLIQECLAVRLELELGEIIYTSNSFHIYSDEFSHAEDFLSSGCEAKPIDPHMQHADDDTIKALIAEEQRIRLLSEYDSKGSTALDEYWERFLEPLRKFCSSI
ncbi:thymidylate synthase [Jannaschia sp. KMU-145]|uniref:thymidylate synthase n=1 Tax=Jannaschia halovivens TaxID=3388667 RepID=UPI00396B2037